MWLALLTALADCSDTLPAAEGNCTTVLNDNMCTIPYYRGLCPVTCDSCLTLSPTAAPTECSDTYHACADVLANGLCINGAYQDVCLVTCDICSPLSPTSSPLIAATISDPLWIALGFGLLALFVVIVLGGHPPGYVDNKAWSREPPPKYVDDEDKLLL